MWYKELLTTKQGRQPHDYETNSDEADEVEEKVYE